MDKYLFSYATASDPPIKRGLDSARRESHRPAEAQADLCHNQRFPRAGENFWQAAVRSLELDVRYDADALAAMPRTGPVVFVANHPYGVLDGIVMAWLVSKVRSRFRRSYPHRSDAGAGGGAFHPAGRFLGTPRKPSGPISPRARRRATISTRGGAVVVFPAGAISTAPDKLGLKPAVDGPLAAVRVAAHPVFAGDGSADLVRRPEQPPFPDRQSSQPDAAPLAHLP